MNDSAFDIPVLEFLMMEEMRPAKAEGGLQLRVEPAACLAGQVLPVNTFVECAGRDHQLHYRARIG
jgi:hypothetical protein